MSHRCNYRILPDYNLIISNYAGDITENEIISLKEAITLDKAFDIRYNTLDDYTDAIFHITQESYRHAFNWLRNHYAWKRNSAVITNTPEQVVNITLFNYMQNGELPMKIRIFSGLEAALLWVNLTPKDLPIIKTILIELKTSEVVF